VKLKLAHRIVSIFHSEADADAARARWDEVFRGGSGIPDDIPEERLDAEERVIDILRRLNMVASGKEAKRLIDQKGVRIDQEPVTDAMTMVKPDMLPVILQVGKRKFVRLIAD
jgi:tyrosyl-tRNA synthetase